MRFYSVLVYNSVDHTLFYKNFNLTDFYFYTHYKIKTEVIQMANEYIKNLDEKKLMQSHKFTEEFNNIIFNIYIYKFGNKIYLAVTNEKYPSSVILEFINELKELLNKENHDTQEIDILWTKYQDPLQVSKLLQVKQNLDETKKIMMDSVDKILERGERIENLIEKTDQLQLESEAFRIKAKKLNSCCWIL